MSKWVFEKRHSIVIAVFVLLSIAFVTLFYRTDLRKSLLVAKHDVGIDNIDAIKAIAWKNEYFTSNRLQ
jgi:hypothetical protein